MNKNKIINLVMQTVAYFLIVLFIFWITRKMDIKTDTPIITLAIGSTIGWAIFQVGTSIIKKRKQTK